MQLSPQHAHIYIKLLDVGYKSMETGVQRGILEGYRALYQELGADGSRVVHGVSQFFEGSINAKVFHSSRCQTSFVPPPPVGVYCPPVWGHWSRRRPPW